MVVFTASASDWKYPFWASQTRKINGDVHSTVLEPKQPFYSKFVSKNQNCWGWNLEPTLILICRIRWRFSFYSFLDWEYPFRS